MISTPSASHSAEVARELVAPMPVSLRRLAQAMILILLVASPLGFLPNVLLANAFDTPRRLLLMLGAGLLTALILQSWSLRRQIIYRKHRLDLAVMLFALAAVITSFTSAYPWIPFWGPVWSKDGLQVVGPAILLYFGIKEFMREPAEIIRAVAVMVLTGGLVAFIGLIEYLGIITFHLPLSGYRLTGTMGNSMFAGAYLATLLPLAFGVALVVTDKRLRIALAASFALMLPALVFTQSRAAWIGFIVAAVFTLLLALNAKQRVRENLLNVRWVALTLLIAFLLTGAVWLLHARLSPDRQVTTTRVESLGHLGNDTSVQDRKVIMIGALRMFLARPVQGWGIGVSRYVLPQYKPAGGNRGYVQAAPHSIPLQVAAEMGLLGLLPYLLLLLLLFVHAYKTAQRSDALAWLGVGFFGAFFANFITNLFSIDNAATLSLFWICLGLLAALSAEERACSLSSQQPSGPSSAWAPLCCKWAGVLLGTVTIAMVLTQLFAAYYLQKGVDGIAHLEAVAKIDRMKTRELGDGVAADVIRSLSLTIMPSLSRPRTLTDLPDGDSLSWQTLATVYQTESHVYPDPASMTASHREMIAAGQENLSKLDRDSILGDLIVEHMHFSDVRTTAYSELKEARALMSQLLVFSPDCSQSHLLNAQLLDLEGNADAAMREAQYTLQLDPKFAQAMRFLGHLYCKEALGNMPQQQALARQACTTFEAANQTQEAFDAPDLEDYATTLFLVNDLRHAATVAQTLRGQKEFGKLCERIRTLSRQQAYEKTGNTLLKMLL